MKYGISLLVLGVICFYLSSHMFGDIGLAGMIGSLSILLSGLGFINLSNKGKEWSSKLYLMNKHKTKINLKKYQ